MLTSLTTELTSITWYAIWKYIRTAPTLATVRVRLDELLLKFPKSKTYVDFLWRNVATWATCAFTWELDYGFQASSMQEGMRGFRSNYVSYATYHHHYFRRTNVNCYMTAKIITFYSRITYYVVGIHSTLKRHLRGVLIPLHKTLPYFRESLARRKLNVDRKNSSASLKSLLEFATEAGFSRFSKTLTSSLTDEGIKLTLDQFRKGVCYTVEKLVGSSAINKCLHITLEGRGPSAARFRCLITQLADGNIGESEFVEGDYYKVTSRLINGSTDIVLISSGGNIACTSPSYARWGIPSKHIFAVFYNGGMCLNLKQHFHPVYHLPFMNDIALNLVADFTATADIQNGPAFSTDSSTSWNWAQQTSLASWETIGLGGAEFSSVVHPTARFISKAPESSIERTKKAINYLVPYINNSVEERKMFYLYYEGVLKRYDHLIEKHFVRHYPFLLPTIP